MADDVKRSQESGRRSDPPRFEAQGRPPHDWFQDGKVIQLRLAPDYPPPGWVPLWPSSDDTDALVPSELLPRLTAWQDEFNQNFYLERGRGSGDVGDRWASA